MIYRLLIMQNTLIPSSNLTVKNCHLLIDKRIIGCLYLYQMLEYLFDDIFIFNKDDHSH